MMGQTISHYKILEKLGEGGMGVVYKAQDMELDRFVAIKALPERLHEHELEHQRFIQEAKAASALNHANVCTIHDFLKDDGKLYIVMEYVDGKTLREAIQAKAPDVSTAINYALQIGEALEEAHSKGIVHRDVKPENIMVNSKNQIKVMDFGLAKLKGSLKLTRTSSTVGTLAYMAPEQLQGGEVDARSDIFSFGIVLYEMLSGHPPFRGEHEAALMYSILNEEPTPIERYREDIPAELQHVLSRAIEKDPEERYQSVHEMLIDLRRLKKVSTRVVHPGGEEAEPKFKKRSFIVRYKVPVIALAAILLASVAYLFLVKRGVEINPAFTTRWIEVPYNTIAGLPALSPDGKWIVFGAEDKAKKWDMYVVRTTGGEVRRLTQDSSQFAGWGNISLDGDKIAYNRWSGGTSLEICIVPMNGGGSKRIGAGVEPKWSPDGNRIGYFLEPRGGTNQVSKSGNGEFWTVNPDGTDNRLEFMDSIVTKDVLPVLAFAWSPDGRSVAWVRKLKQRYCEIVIHDLATHTERPVISDQTHKNEICWAPNDLLIYSSAVGDEMNLWMVPASGGTPVPVTKGLRSVDFPMVSKDGRILLFLQYRTTGHLWLASLDGSARREEVFSSEQYFEYPDISPDGKLISVGMNILGTLTRHLFIMNRDGTNIRQITSGEIACYKPRWSPDGKMISYYARGRYEPNDSFKVYVVNPHKLDVPRYVYYGVNQSWKDSVTLMMNYRGKTWLGYLDGRPAIPFSQDSISCCVICNGQFVYFTDIHRSAIITREPAKLCRSEDWDGIGPGNSLNLGTRMLYPNYDALYTRDKLDIFRFSSHDWKKEKLNVNVQGIDTLGFFIRTTADGKEMVYKTTEQITKLGMIENLFK